MDRPRNLRTVAQLASCARLILYDKPGTGPSDPIPELPTLEERVADIKSVLDTAGSERAVLFGISEGGPASILIATMRPQRITSLILYGTIFPAPTPARSPRRAPDHRRSRASRPHGFSIEREITIVKGERPPSQLLVP